MNNQKTVIEIKDLKKSYGDNHVLNGFNMRLVEGENLVIMGKSGSGKSVMIKCLIGLEKPDSGSIIGNSHVIPYVAGTGSLSIVKNGINVTSLM